MDNNVLSRPEQPRITPAPPRRAHIRTVARVAVISIIVSELITIALTTALLDDALAEGMIIALVCAGPISAWIAHRQLQLRDVITRQRDEMETLNRELNARNTDLDAFARAVAHDLKNPPTAIVGIADILAGNPDLARIAQAREPVQSILDSGDQAVEIINGILLLHGIHHETPKLIPVDTGATIASALQTLAKEMAGNDAVVTEHGAIPSVRAYRPWLVQVWVNLISNASKYGGSPPRVDIAACAMPGGMVRLEVADNGPGIPAADHDRVFHEFERGSTPDIEGHGLGLAIVKRIINRLGGETGVEDGKNGGAVFWFTLPAV